MEDSFICETWARFLAGVAACAAPTAPKVIVPANRAAIISREFFLFIVFMEKTSLSFCFLSAADYRG